MHFLIKHLKFCSKSLPKFAKNVSSLLLVNDRGAKDLSPDPAIAEAYGITKNRQIRANNT